MIRLAATNFAGRFIDIRNRESSSLKNFAPPEAQNRTNRPARHHLHDVHNNYPLAPEHMTVWMYARLVWIYISPEDGRICWFWRYIHTCR